MIQFPPALIDNSHYTREYAYAMWLYVDLCLVPILHKVTSKYNLQNTLLT